jgi:hypothetical protein
MANGRIPTVRVYVREKDGKRSFRPEPRIPDLSACYWLRYEKDRGQVWQRVGHYDLVAREKLLLERRLSAETQGFILPEDQAAEKDSASRAAVDAYLESLGVRATSENHRWQELRTQSVHDVLQTVLHGRTRERGHA